jgi:S1-C subfamily serine protease
MAMDLAVELIQATVQLEQPQGDGTRTVGTGFLIAAQGPDGRPRTVLVTANHVFETMPGAKARIGYRISNPDGSWSYSPQPVQIRDDEGHELWTHHPSRDVAAIAIKAPPEFARAALPESYLAGDDTFGRYQVNPGDEMMALGFPRGLSANSAGFPILRSGRVASYPLAPAKVYPTFLLDFAVFPGNSGGPVFVSRAPVAAPPTQQVSTAAQAATPAAAVTPGPAAPPPEGFIAGLLTQQVELNSERLEIGIVTQAKYIRETIALMRDPLAPATVADGGQADGGQATGARTAAAEEAARN